MTTDTEQYLAINSDLHDRYTILSVLGHGGFGVVYKAHDQRLDVTVAVKEYLPEMFCYRNTHGNVSSYKDQAKQQDYELGLTRFKEEAQRLAKLKHPNIIPVTDYFQSNGTAYIVMPYMDDPRLKGLTLGKYLEEHGKLNAERVSLLLEPLIDALGYIHAQGNDDNHLIHRDISPDNILINTLTDQPILIDFGAARYAAGSRNLSAIIKDGYSPPEQYSRETKKNPQGPYTDIYALSATFYHCITGEIPPSATQRLMDDDIQLLSDHYKDFDPQLLAMIDDGLTLKSTDRPQSVEQWKAAYQVKPSPTLKQEERLPPIEKKVITEPVSPPINKDEGNKKLVITAALVVTVLLVVIAAMFIGSGTPEERYHLVVNTVPKNAQIALIDESERYLPGGIKLQSGVYRIRTTLEGYEPDEREVDLTSMNRTVEITLVEVAKPTETVEPEIKVTPEEDIIVPQQPLEYENYQLVVNTIPENANIYLMGIQESYQPGGVNLSSGIYKIKVIRDGYEKYINEVDLTSGNKTIVVKLNECKKIEKEHCKDVATLVKEVIEVKKVKSLELDWRHRPIYYTDYITDKSGSFNSYDSGSECANLRAEYEDICLDKAESGWSVIEYINSGIRSGKGCVCSTVGESGRKYKYKCGYSSSKAICAYSVKKEIINNITERKCESILERPLECG